MSKKERGKTGVLLLKENAGPYYIWSKIIIIIIKSYSSKPIGRHNQWEVNQTIRYKNV